MTLEKLKQTEFVNGNEVDCPKETFGGGLLGTELSVRVRGHGFEATISASHAEALDRAQRVVSALIGTEEAPAEMAPTLRRRTK